MSRTPLYCVLTPHAGQGYKLTVVAKPGPGMLEAAQAYVERRIPAAILPTTISDTLAYVLPSAEDLKAAFARLTRTDDASPLLSFAIAESSLEEAFVQVVAQE